MNKPKFDNATQGKIARAYRAGGSPTEIGKNYGISCGHVINIAQRWETRQKIRKLEAMAKRHDRLLRMFVQAPPIEAPETETDFYAGCKVTRVVKKSKVFHRKWVIHFDNMITLPFVGEAMGRTLREAR